MVSVSLKHNPFEDDANIPFRHKETKKGPILNKHPLWQTFFQSHDKIT